MTFHSFPRHSFPPTRVIVISTNASARMGGEAMKALHYVRHLIAQGFDAHLLTHARCRDDLAGEVPPDRLHFVEDDLPQKLVWHLSRSQSLLAFLFHRRVRRLCRGFDPNRTVLHYLCPISPITPRLSPPGYDTVIGPLNGNIYFPPRLLSRMSWSRRVAAWLHRPAQRLSGEIWRDKRQARTLLVSGLERTRQSLTWAGCDPARITDVMDCGVTEGFSHRPRPRHRGRNARFIAIGRLVDVKALDIAIRALVRADADATLTVVGDGESRGALERLVTRLGLGDRVTFTGWLPHDVLLDEMARSRALVFPSLAEANGIAVQEAMLAGLPVIATRWGGPAALGADGTLTLIEPTGYGELVNGFAQAMRRLAGDADLADHQAARARQQALRAFPWEVVAASWARHYPAAAHPVAVPAPLLETA